MGPRIDELNEFIDQEETAENKTWYLLQDALDKKDNKEVERLQLRLSQCEAKGELYEIWKQETRTIDGTDLNVSIKTVVETMVSDERFLQMETYYDHLKSELQKKQRKEHMAELETQRLGPPTTTQVVGVSAGVGSQDANRWGS